MKLKLHCCNFNYSKWSEPVINFNGNAVQTRYCLICHKFDIREFGKFSMLNGVNFKIKN